MSKSASSQMLQTAGKDLTSELTGILQRKCASCGTHTIAGDKCGECANKQWVMQRKSSNNTEHAEAPPIVNEVLNSSGQPLDDSTRAFFESRFEHNFTQVPLSSASSQSSQSGLTIGKPNDIFEQEADRIADSVTTKETKENLPAKQQKGEKFDLSRVRIHTDGRAAESARAINAHAYTLGRDIVFGAGQFAPHTEKGLNLLAHELVHVGQQKGSEVSTKVQADFAIEPTVATPAVPTLTPAEIAAAITYNQTRFTNPDEIALLRDILGLQATTPPVIDADFIQAVVLYQADYGLTPDGKLGKSTVEQLSREIIAEGTTLGAGNLQELGLEFRLRDDIQTLITAGNTTYADYKALIQAASPLQRTVALLHRDLLTNLRNTLSWNNFARCVELLGRMAPTYWQLIGEPVVRAAVRRAWNDSNPAVPAVGTTQHEEGGWIFLNLITGAITTRRAAAGGGAVIDLGAPPAVTDSVVVGVFHTHPNLGPGWTAGPSPADNTADTNDGIPDIVAGTTGIDPTRFDLFQSGPLRRHHLAGNRGMPGAAGGLAPQGKADGTYDKR